MQDSVVDDEVVMYDDIQSGEHRFLVAYCVCDASFCRDILSEALPISSFHPLFGLSCPSPSPLSSTFSMIVSTAMPAKSILFLRFTKAIVKNSEQMVLFKIRRANVHEFVSF